MASYQAHRGADENIVETLRRIVYCASRGMLVKLLAKYRNDGIHVGAWLIVFSLATEPISLLAAV